MKERKFAARSQVDGRWLGCVQFPDMWSSEVPGERESRREYRLGLPKLAVSSPHRPDSFFVWASPWLLSNFKCNWNYLTIRGSRG